MNLESITSFFDSAYGIFLIVVFFGGSIFVHELGHFLAARKRGLKIERFSIGFGPRIFGWTGKDGVDYRISLLPLGGYVALPQMVDMEAIEGKNENDGEKLPPISYTDKIIVAVAGVVFNIIFAFLLACVLWVAKMPSNDAGTTIGYVTQTLDQNDKTPSPAAAAGLRAGDTILAIDGSPVSGFKEINEKIIGGTDKDSDGNPRATFTIKRGNETLDVVVMPKLRSPLPGDNAPWRHVGISPAEDIVIAQPEKNTPADKAGLKRGDKIIAVNGTPVYTIYQLVEIIGSNNGNEVSLTVAGTDDGSQGERTVPVKPMPLQRTVETAKITFDEKGTTRTLNFLQTPDDLNTKDKNAERRNLTAYTFLPADSEIGKQISVGSIIDGVDTPAAIVAVRTPKDLADAVAETKSDTVGLFFKSADASEKIMLKNLKAEVVPPNVVSYTGIRNAVKSDLVRKNPVEQLREVFVETFSTLGKLFNRKSDIGVNHLMGVVGMAKVYYTASDDLRRVIWFTIVININLAILNILPIPVLDGGHILIATIQRIAGRPLPLKILVTIQYIFVGLLFAMMGYVILNDLKRCSSSRTHELQLKLQERYYLLPPELPAELKTPGK